MFDREFILVTLGTGCSQSALRKFLGMHAGFQLYPIRHDLRNGLTIRYNWRLTGPPDTAAMLAWIGMALVTST